MQIFINEYGIAKENTGVTLVNSLILLSLSWNGSANTFWWSQNTYFGGTASTMHGMWCWLPAYTCLCTALNVSLTTQNMDI